MEMLDIKERYQETSNDNGAVFFVESSDHIKFHVFDKGTHELIGKAVVESSAELSEKVAELITFD